MAYVTWLLCLLIVSSMHQASQSLSIAECDGGWITVSETKVQHITCGHINPNDDVQWLIFSDSGLTRSLFCTPQHCSASGDLVLSMGNGTHRTLTIRDNARALANNGQVICLAGQLSTSCKINVIHPANVTGCQIHRNLTNTGNGYVVDARCHFTEAYSSNGTYRCSLLSYTPGDHSPGTNIYTAGLLYINGSSGWCLVHFTYTSLLSTFSVVLFPDKVSSYPGQNVAVHLDVRHDPMGPVTNCTMATVIAEGDNLVCACQVNPHFLGAGFPPVQGVTWNDWPGPLVPVDLFKMFNVNRHISPARITCTTFLPTTRAPIFERMSISVIVAYGPDAMTLSEDRERLSDDGTLVLTCSAFTFSPGVVFTWSGAHCDSVLHQGNNSFCVIARPHLVVDHTVTCKVANSAFERVMKQASVTLTAGFLDRRD